MKHLLRYFTAFLFPVTCLAQSPNLGTASGFALFTSVGAFTNTGATNITGDIGTNVGALTGFPPGTIIGQAHTADATAALAATDANAAYTQLGSVACGAVIGTTLGSGQTLTPNVYCLGAATTLNGDLILDGQGDLNALFIFKVDGALTTGTFSNIELINGATLCNVYWRVNGAFDLADNSFFKGTIFANGAITFEGSSSYYGRAISIGGAISLHNNLVAIMEAPAVPTITGNSDACIGQYTTFSNTMPNGTWSSSDTALAAINSTGDILGIAAGTPTITYTVTNTGGCITSKTKIITVHNVPTASINGSSSICSGTSTNLTVNLTNGAPWSITYTDSTTPITINSINSATYSIAVAPTSSKIYTLTSVTSNGCSAVGTGAATITVLAGVPIGYTHGWNGSIDTNWNNAANWCPPSVPTITDGAYIHFVSNQPTIVSLTQSIKNMGIDSGAVVKIDYDATLAITKSVLSKGKIIGLGNLVMNGNSADTISGIVTIASLSINNTSGTSILGGNTNTLNVTQVLTVAGVFNTNGNLVLTSNSNGSVRVAESYGTIIGAATVQRYIPGKRAWRFLTAPLSSNGMSDVTLSNSWQLNTYIVGPSGTGLDFASPRYNMQTFSNNNWVNVSDPISNLLFNNTASTSNKAFASFIVGDRTASNLIIPNFNNTTLSATGKLLQGTQTYNLNNLLIDDYIFIGNPYASPIDLNQVYLNTATTNINRTFYTWDPLIGTGLNTGGYVTISWDGNNSYDIVPSSTAQKQHIQSGQAFFVQAAATNAVISFEENDKSNNSINSVFGSANNTNDKLFINLQKNTGTGLITTDGVLSSFGATYSKTVLWNEDAEKLSNNEERITLVRGSNWLSIERRPYISTDADTLFLRVNNLTLNTAYAFQFKPQNWDIGMQAVVVDNTLFTETPISLQTINIIQFTATATNLNNRFIIIIKNAGALYNNTIHIQAKHKEKAVTINWNIATEQDIKEYWIERSLNAKDFEEIGIQKANGNINYLFTDNTLQNINNTVNIVVYYRIKSILNNDQVKYSGIAAIRLLPQIINSITVYPNPIKGNMIQLQLVAFKKGNYTATLMDGLGKKMAVLRFEHTGGTATKTLQPNYSSTIQNGFYQLLIEGNGLLKTLPIYISNNN
jgi:hypothetical protein